MQPLIAGPVHAVVKSAERRRDVIECRGVHGRSNVVWVGWWVRPTVDDAVIPQHAIYIVLIL